MRYDSYDPEEGDASPAPGSRERGDPGAMRVALRAMVLLVLGALFATCATFGDEPPLEDELMSEGIEEAPEEAPELEFWDPRPRVVMTPYALGAAGSFKANANPGRLRGGWGGGMAFGMDLFIHPNAAIGFEAIVTNMEYTAPEVSMLLVETDDKMTVDGTSLVLTGKLTHAWSRFEPGVGVGVGLHRAKIAIPASFIGLPGTVGEETAFTHVFQVIAGLDIVWSRKVRVGIQYRVLAPGEVDLGALSGGRVDVGGSLVTVGVSWLLDGFGPGPAGADAAIPRPVMVTGRAIANP